MAQLLIDTLPLMLSTVEFGGHVTAWRRLAHLHSNRHFAVNLAALLFTTYTATTRADILEGKIHKVLLDDC